MTQLDTDTARLDELVRTYLDLTDKIEQLTATRETIKEQLRSAGPGRHDTTYGVSVTVSPQRRFDIDRAWSMLTPEQQAVCVTPDAKKVKAQLPPALADDCMVESGDPRVVVR